MKVIIILATVALVRAQFECPNEDGQYPDDKQCDKFWDCRNGEAVEMLCPDGLVFDSTKTRKIYKCEYPFSVECGNRTLLQTANPSDKCPRRNGFFSHPDTSICDTYYYCVDGNATEVKCSDGHHFDEQTGLCKWAYLLTKKGCKAPNHSFVCPKVKQVDSDNLRVHLVYPDFSDCQKFYMCFNGFEPRELSCPYGEVFNDASQKCDSPENVQGCEDWYDKFDDIEDTTDVIEF